MRLLPAHDSPGSHRTLLGPPVGGALYARWGYRAPFVFGMSFIALDLVGRVLVVESLPHQDQDRSHESETNELAERVANTPGEPHSQKSISPQNFGSSTAVEQSKLPGPSTLDNNPLTDINQPHRKSGDAPILRVFWRLMTTPRSLLIFIVSFFCSYVWFSPLLAMSSGLS